jgi:hypothetical protein
MIFDYRYGMADIPIFSSNAVLVLKITDQDGKDYIYIDSILVLNNILSQI